MKKIILLVLGMVFLTNCEGNVAVKPENRESFTENPYFKSEKFLAFKNKEERLNYIKTHEYNTFLEALKNTFDWGEGTWEKMVNKEKNKKYINEIERMTKSKFYSIIGDTFCYIYFTSIDDKETNKNGKYNIKEVVFYYDIEEINSVDVPIIKSYYK